jgi:hypothetical protein
MSNLHNLRRRAALRAIGGCEMTARLFAMAISLVAVAASTASVAQHRERPKLAVVGIDAVRQVGTVDFEVLLALQDGSKIRLDMNVFTLQDIAQQLSRIVATDETNRE